MFISQHMTRNPMTIGPEVTIPEARRLLRSHNFRHLPVVDAANRLVGIVTDRDLRSAYPSTMLSGDKLEAALAELAATPVSSIMSREFFTLSPASTLDDALLLLDREKIGALPVVDDEGRVIGIFSMRDLTSAYRKIFGLGERGSAMIVVEHDGKPKPLMRLAHILEDQNIRFTRLIRTESRDNQPDRIYLRVNTFNIHAVHHALHQAGFHTIQPEVNNFASK